MTEEELLKRHFAQKPAEEGDLFESFSELEFRLQSLLTDRFKDAKDDSMGRQFKTEMLQSLSGDEKQEFERLVNELIGCSQWFDYYSDSPEAKTA